MARALVVALVLAGILVACGKKGDPLPPNPDTATWPRQYPTR
jgi:predicted small lipoprotein YifL